MVKLSRNRFSVENKKKPTTKQTNKKTHQKIPQTHQKNPDKIVSLNYSSPSDIFLIFCLFSSVTLAGQKQV